MMDWFKRHRVARMLWKYFHKRMVDIDKAMRAGMTDCEMVG